MHVDNRIRWDEEHLESILRHVAESLFPLDWRSAALVVQRDGGESVPVALVLNQEERANWPP